MKNYLPLLALLSLSAFLFTNCQSSDDESGPRVIIKECPTFEVTAGNLSDPFEYEIINVILEEQYAEKDIIHIMGQTIVPILSGEDINSFLEDNQASVLEQELLDNYEDKNQTAATWNPLFREATLFSEIERNCFFSNNPFPCESYRAKYPNASSPLSFARPAIYNDIAVVEYIDSSCASLAGYLVVLAKENDTWVIKQHTITIIS